MAEEKKEQFAGVYDYAFHLVPPEEKTKEWGLAYLKQRYPLWTSYFGSPYWNGRVDYQLIKLYGEGRQPESIYYKDFYPDGYMQNQTGSWNDWLGMRWEIVSPIPNFKNNIITKLEAATYPEIQCEAIDQLAKDKKLEKRLQLKFGKVMDDFLEEISDSMQLATSMKSNIAEQPQQENLPDFEFDFDDDAELGMYMNMYCREPVEIANELAINSLFELNEYAQILREVREDALDYGIAASRTYMNENTCMPKIEWLQLGQIRAGWGMRRDYKDIEGWSYPNFMTLNQVVEKFGKELTPERLRALFAHGVTNYGYWTGNSWNTNYTYSWDEITKYDFEKVRILVAYFEFKSQNYETAEYKKTKYGGLKVKKKSKKETATDGDNEIVESWAQVVYKGYYVVGSDEIFNWGLMPNMVREEGKEQQVQFSLNMYRFAEKGFTEHCIPHADGIQLAYLKYQLELRQSVPSGHAFDIDRLATVNLGDGKKLDTLEMMRLFMQTGKYPFKSLDEDANPLPSASNGVIPIVPLVNGISQSVQGYFMAIDFHMKQIYTITGYNPITMEGQPTPPRTSAIATQVAAQNSNNTIDYLIRGINTMIENTAKYMNALILDMATYKGEGWEALKQMIGNVNTSVIEAMDDIPLHQYAIWLKEKISDEEMAEFKQMLLQAWNKNNLQIDDLLNVWFEKDWKQAVGLIQLRLKKQRAQMQQAQQASEQQMQAMEQAQMQMQMAIKQLEAQVSARNTDVKTQGLLEQEKLKNNAKIFQQSMIGQQKNQHIAEQTRGDILKQQLEPQKETA